MQTSRLTLALVALFAPRSAGEPPIGFVEVDDARFVSVVPGRSVCVHGGAIEWRLFCPDSPRLATARGCAPTATESPRSVRLRWDGDVEGARARGAEVLPGVVNLLHRADPASWRTGNPHFRRVRTAGWLPGVAVEVRQRDAAVALDLLVDDGAASGEVAFVLDGADRIDVDDTGRVIATAGSYRLVLERPRAFWTMPDGDVRAVRCRLLRRGIDRFAVAYEAFLPLAAPPAPAAGGAVLGVSTYVGGSLGGVNDVVDVPVVAVDDGENGPRSIVLGSTTSLDFPVTAGAFDVIHDGGPGPPSFDAFVACFGADGGLEWATFLGGEADDFGYGVGVMEDGSVVVTGATVSTGFPVTAHAFDATLNNGPMSCVVAGELRYDAFVSVLAPDGASLTYSTYLGGSLVDAGIAVAVEPGGRVQVGGITTANPGFEDLPVTADAFSRQSSGLDCTQSDGFVARFDPAASGAASLLYCTYFGGAQQDAVRALAVDRFGETYVALETNSPLLPVTPGAFQSANAGPNGDGYAARLDLSKAGGSALRYGTFFGGAKIDMALGIAPTDAGTAWVTGVTTSPEAGAGAPFPTTPTGFDGTLGGVGDAFLVHLDACGKSLLAATYLGGTGDDHGRAVRVDRFGDVVVTGTTGSLDFPVTPDAFATLPCGAGDVFLARLSVDGSALRYATRVGGAQDDLGSGLAVDGAGTAHVVGTTLSVDFPTTSGPPLGGASDPFMLRLTPGVSVANQVDSWGGGGAAVALAGDLAAVGASEDAPGGLVDAGSVTVRRRTLLGWTVDAVLVPSGAAAGDHFGEAIAVSAEPDRVVAGAPLASAARGAVSVFTANGASFHEAGLVAADGLPGDRFGASVAHEGTRLVVGAPHAGVGGAIDAGAVYVFTEVLGTWVESAKLTAPSPSPGDRFGASLALVAGDLAVGAPGADLSSPDAGAVFWYVAGSGSSWSWLATGTPSDAVGGDAFGSALDGDEACFVVGAPARHAFGLADVGAAYVFARESSGVTEVARLGQDVLAAGDRFGASVAIAGDRIVVGAPGAHGGVADAGSLAVFARVGAVWRPAGRLGAAAASAGDASGAAVALAGRTALGGAPGAPGLGAGGRVDVFTLADGLTIYGAGCAGGTGVAPTLAATGTPGPGGGVTLHLANGRPGASALLLLGTGRDALPIAPGCALLVSGVLAAHVGPFFLDSCGAATIAGSLPVGAPPATLTTQAFVDDPSVPPAWSCSNGLEIVIE